MKIKGNKKPNELVGSDEDDKIMGLGGDDDITAKGGHDDVDGGDGDDKIVIAANTSATVDAGKGNDTVKVGPGALGSTIDLGKGNDSVEVKESSQSTQSFGIAGGKGNDSVNFALAQAAYTITEGGDESYTVVDANGNSYALSSISSLTFDGVAYVPPVVDPNEAPVVSTPIADQTATANSAYSFQFATNAFTDPDSDALTYTATLADGGALPSWLTFDAATRTFSGTPTASNVGAISVRVTASDGSLSAADDFTITVGNTAPPPGVATPPLSGGVLYLNGPYTYNVVESTGADKLFVTYLGETFTYKLSDITEINTVGSSRVDMDTGGLTPKNITGNVNFVNVTFVQANVAVDSKFEASFDLSDDFNVSGTINVNGGIAGYFRTAWDHFDEAYTAIQNHGGTNLGNPALFGDYSNSTPYGNTTLGAAAFEVNNAFLDLAEDYIAYLEAGGPALMDIVKFTAGSRSQSLHDNILGNIAINSLTDRDLNTADNLARFDDWVNREWVSGNTNTAGHTATLLGVAFDFENDINRTDYHSFDTAANDADLTDAQKDDIGGTDTLLINGTPAEHFHVTTFNAAGISMGLAAHKYAGIYADGYVSGTTYTVEDGFSSSGTRAHWSFAMTVEDGLNGSALNVGNASIEGDYDVGIWLDIDPTTAEEMVFLDNLEEIADSFTVDGDIFQNSWNINFDFIKSQLKDDYELSYATGAKFGIELRLTDTVTDLVVMTNHIDVLVV